MNPLRQCFAVGLLTVLVSGPAAFAAEARLTFIDPAAPEAASVRQAGEAASAIVATRLVTELTAALGAGGPEKAVEICHTKALPLTNAPLPGQPQVVAVKRTSLRLRNPANAPDAADQLALDHIRSQMENGDAPSPLLIQRVESPSAPPEWRVYKPLGTTANCLVCHGDPAEQPDALRAKLNQLYPADQATGYSAREWRGLIRVTVADAPIKKP